jgi:hypothetical protein
MGGKVVWFLVLGSWFLVLGSWFLVLGSWCWVLGWKIVGEGLKLPGAICGGDGKIGAGLVFKF